MEGKITTPCRRCFPVRAQRWLAPRWPPRWLKRLAGDRVHRPFGRVDARSEDQPGRHRRHGRNRHRHPRVPQTTGPTEIVQAADVVITMGCGDACPDLPRQELRRLGVPDPASVESPPCGRSATTSGAASEPPERAVGLDELGELQPAPIGSSRCGSVPPARHRRQRRRHRRLSGRPRHDPLAGTYRRPGRATPTSPSAGFPFTSPGETPDWRSARPPHPPTSSTAAGCQPPRRHDARSDLDPADPARRARPPGGRRRRLSTNSDRRHRCYPRPAPAPRHRPRRCSPLAHHGRRLRRPRAPRRRPRSSSSAAATSAWSWPTPSPTAATSTSPSSTAPDGPQRRSTGIWGRESRAELQRTRRARCRTSAARQPDPPRRPASSVSGDGFDDVAADLVARRRRRHPRHRLGHEAAFHRIRDALVVDRRCAPTSPMCSPPATASRRGTGSCERPDLYAPRHHRPQAGPDRRGERGWRRPPFAGSLGTQVVKSSTSPSPAPASATTKPRTAGFDPVTTSVPRLTTTRPTTRAATA